MATATAAALIELRDLRKDYGGQDGSPAVQVLRGVDLQIRQGEFVAIVGASGSGKSTLMNILGCLDRPSAGQYLFNGSDVAAFDADRLAWLRREAFGFVFQGYHLIPTESACENVELPAIYAGLPEPQRRQRAAALLARLGLAQRLDNRPHQLSGGQQQRVSIARALMNGGRIILADEPTGALDSQSGAEVMQLFHELADAGHTIILITHDREVAAQARRVIEVRDGSIIGDSGAAPDAPAQAMPDLREAAASQPPVRRWRDELREAARAAWRVMWVNRFRTALTLLGIVIGVASVIVMMAIGLGTRQQVVAQLGRFGSNLMYMAAIGESSRIPGRSITLQDLEAVADLPNITHVLPNVTGNKVVRHGNQDIQTYVRGTGAGLPEIQTWPLARGAFFTAEDERELASVAVLGHRLARELMPEVPDPVGQMVLIGNSPFQVIGVMSEKGALSGDRDEDNLLLMPFSTAGAKVFGQREPTYTVMAVADVGRIQDTQQQLEALLLERHGIRDFSIGNAAASIAAEASTRDTMTMMLSLVAAVSLLVGGIGVMNVMLMTVRERTREIGIRLATGARQRDILRQFLTEAVLVTLVGGAAGVGLGVAVGLALMAAGVPLIFSLTAMLAAFGCAVLTGLLFGYMPARRAARLDPVVALSTA
ncbi:macrolide transporter ATP-binding /permease protein [Herbaspirillum frisingense GSF30]|uniref:Pyoverdine export ATP-binding/permease protein PvdT n=1 Tax=Herbaspirillum frisingense GSF30 TaxID=864073 RepID=A0AAI9N2I4_9BURK|nr:MacB family efflux pump subunit [Herbaspirillum frisingense]EOA03413.1 macrolide transporter ATP-binding /permease protein [Herbaspirillum frisingense GSF30]